MTKPGPTAPRNTEVPLIKSIVQRPVGRALAIVAPAAILATAVAVGPSFAGSFLTRGEAVKTFVKKSAAEKQYLTSKEAKSQFVEQADLTPAPFARVASSTADTGPIFSPDPYEVPGARAVFKTSTETANVVITFSGQATCTGEKAGVGCPVQVLVDGYATDKVNLLTSTTGSSQPKESVRTITRPAIVTPGKHVISVRYAGVKDNVVGFKLTDWNLIVEIYPEGPEVAEEE